MGGKRVQVEHLIADPGAKVEGYLRVGELQDGTQIRIPLAIINGSRPGKTLYIQAASDGDELNGVAVVQHIIRAIDPSRLRGAIIAVPIVNVLAFQRGQQLNPIDNKKMNRCFPGRRDGTLSERIAYRLYNSAVKQADLCIDLHQGGAWRMIDEVRVRVGEGNRCYEESMELARVFGLGYILDKKGPDGQLARAAPQDGIPAIDPELGGGQGWDRRSIEKGIRGVMNVLKFYGMLPGEPEIPRRQVVVHDLKEIVVDRGGFLRFKVELYMLVKKGDVVAEVTDPFGNVIEEVRSPYDGVMWAQKPRPMAASGEAIAFIGTF